MIGGLRSNLKGSIGEWLRKENDRSQLNLIVFIKILKYFLSYPGITCMRYSAVGVLACAWREISCLLFFFFFIGGKSLKFTG